MEKKKQTIEVIKRVDYNKKKEEPAKEKNNLFKIFKKR
jgi:hypothetical protein